MTYCHSPLYAAQATTAIKMTPNKIAIQAPYNI